jgi:Glycosyl transferase family 2
MLDGQQVRREGRDERQLRYWEQARPQGPVVASRRARHLRRHRRQRQRRPARGTAQALPWLRWSTIIGTGFSTGVAAVITPGTSSWQLRDCERLITGNAALLAQQHFLIAITRLRNEALILQDSLNYVGKHVDAIIAYDDASTDRTLDILRSHPKVALIVSNGSWEEDIQARRIAEFRHRGLLLQVARAKLQFDWMFCFDADERVIGDLRGFAAGSHADDCDGMRIRLFDAYMTPEDCAPYQSDRELLDFRRFFGPERRDILMLWRNHSEVFFAEGHSREPGGLQRLQTDLYCQHYGKSLSIQHWEETCDYYIRHFPFDTYGRKWLDRKGRAIHTQSDFMRPLYEWSDVLFANATTIREA